MLDLIIIGIMIAFVAMVIYHARARAHLEQQLDAARAHVAELSRASTRNRTNPAGLAGPDHERHVARCARRGCTANAWAIGRLLFEWRTGPNGDATVRRTKTGAYACREHAHEIGGGWATP